MLWKPIYLLQAILGIRIQVAYDPLTSKQSPFQQKQKVNMPGGYRSCYLMNLEAQNQTFRVMVDTGSSDTTLPSNILNNYKGPNITGVIPDILPYYSEYGDTSYWHGYQSNIDIGISNTTIHGIAPVLVMVNQSTDPLFADGEDCDGLFGVGFPFLSSNVTEPNTLLESWYKNNVIQKNEVAFHGCPYHMEKESWIDIGNETPYSDCGNQSVTFDVQFESYYTLNVTAIAIANQSVALPVEFQGTYPNGFRKWSILDSCTSIILVPDLVMNSFVMALIESYAFPLELAADENFLEFLNGNVGYSFEEKDIAWDLLPSLSFSLSTSIGNVDLVLGPRNYLQATTEGYYFILISGQNNDMAILGLPFFSAYHITADLLNGNLKFQLGCGCKNSTENYPQIIHSSASIAPLSPPTIVPQSTLTTLQSTVPSTTQTEVYTTMKPTEIAYTTGISTTTVTTTTAVPSVIITLSPTVNQTTTFTESNPSPTTLMVFSSSKINQWDCIFIYSNFQVV
ncbi:aspartic peptidase domain-containing protein [Globomyces pollinis-pini]|nr:aspartic peptidase domain-containing protein [Globomyces pollinis-pini]